MTVDATRGTAADAMIHFPRTCGPATTVGQVRELFRDDHLHAVLVVDDSELVSVVERPDISAAPSHAPARWSGRLRGRTTGPSADLEATRRAMTDRQRRRLAVIDDHGALLGLLCLKSTGLGFCSDVDVRARAGERRGQAAGSKTATQCWA
jgi:CBS domain-containing protein